MEDAWSRPRAPISQRPEATVCVQLELNFNNSMNPRLQVGQLGQFVQQHAQHEQPRHSDKTDIRTARTGCAVQALSFPEEEEEGPGEEVRACSN